jgi:hypothetical protein
MKRLLELLASLAATAAAVAAAATPAHKVPLTRTNRNCNGDVLDLKTPSFGFVNLVETGADKLVAAVVLKGATPHTTYDVRLIQDTFPPGTTDCPSYVATLTTDGSGDGSTNGQHAVEVGAHSAFVDLNSRDNPGTDFFTTDPDMFKF